MIGVIVAGIAVAAALMLPKLLGKQNASTTVVTYNVEEITYGNVSTTVSGSGNLTPVSQQTFTADFDGTVKAVNASVGDEVEKGKVIAAVTYTAVDRDGSESTKNAEIKAPYDGILIELPVAADDTLAQGDEICMIMGKDGFTMGVAVDELNISNIRMGQTVQYTLDAKSGTYSGEVTSISYNGTTSGSTTAYEIQTKLDYIEGVYPGMSASAKIVVENSGEGLLVPVDAVYTSGDTKYVYLAPSDAETGAEYEEGAIDLDKMTKATVTTGMSDGSYIMIDSDSLSKGDRILIKRVTSTAAGSDSDSDRSSMFPGGGNYPGGEGFDFGDFDFDNMPEGFDPSNRPGGGGGYPGSGK